MMNVIVKEVKTKKEMKTFVYLPERINADRPLWVPPLYTDDQRSFDDSKNPSHAYCDKVYAIAWRDGKPVGRIAGIINKRFNKLSNTFNCRFGYIDCIDDPTVVKALLDYVETWGMERGMTGIVGPMGFTEEDPEGLQIEGFEETASMASFQNRPSLPGQVEALGYEKEVDYVVYEVTVKTAMTDIYGKIFERINRNKDLRLIEFSKRKDLKAYILPIFRLMNDTFKHLYGYSTFEEHEMQDLADRYYPVVDPRFIKVVLNSANRVIGFFIAIPNMAPGFRKAKGRLFPFGFIHILSASKKSKLLDLYMGAIDEDYRGKGVDVLLGYSMLRSCRDAGIERMDSHHELENNKQIRAEMERAQGRIYKRFRIYKKSFNLFL